MGRGTFWASVFLALIVVAIVVWMIGQLDLEIMP